MDYKFYYSNNNGKDDYGLKYIDELFVSQDMFVGLCEREIAKNKSLK